MHTTDITVTIANISHYEMRSITSEMDQMNAERTKDNERATERYEYILPRTIKWNEERALADPPLEPVALPEPPTIKGIAGSIEEYLADLVAKQIIPALVRKHSKVDMEATGLADLYEQATDEERMAAVAALGGE